MATAAVVGEDFVIGRVVSRTFGTIGRNAGTFFVLAAIAAIPNFLMRFAIGAPTAFDPAHMGSWLGRIYGSLLLYMAVWAVLQAALVHGTVADLNGRKASLSDCLQTGLKSALPVIGISILATLGMALGFIALIVPGIILALAWVVAVPVKVVEKLPVFKCFGRSAALTKGHRGAIFVLAILWWVIAFVLSMLVGVVAGVGMLAGAAALQSNTYMVLGSILGIFTSTVSATGVAAVYYELRSIKEGIGPEQLASVFD